MILVLPAFALDCSDPSNDPYSCAAALQVQQMLNTEEPGLVDDTSATVLTPDGIYARFEELRSRLASAGCHADGDSPYALVSAGSYDPSTLSGSYGDGSTVLGALSGTRLSGGFQAVLGDDARTGTVASGLSGRGTIWADDTHGVAVGHWVRATGKRGWFYVLHAVCPGADPTSALTSWQRKAVDAAVVLPNVALGVPAVAQALLIAGESSPADEGPENTIDGTAAKYLNFNEMRGGVALALTAPADVRCVRVYTANDFPDRDPTSVELSGSHTGDDGDWFPIHVAALDLPTDRNVDTLTAFAEVDVPGGTSYAHYRVLFPTVAGADRMQVGEIELRDAAGDLVSVASATSLGGGNDSPAGEGASNVTDGTTAKFFSYDGDRTRIVFDTGEAELSGMRVFTANDHDNRDPTAWTLEGGLSTLGPWTALTEGTLDLPSARNDVTLDVYDTVWFVTDTSWPAYRLSFTDNKGSPHTQVSEVELYGR